MLQREKKSNCVSLLGFFHMQKPQTNKETNKQNAEIYNF